MLNTDWTEIEVIELIVDNATHLGFGMCGSKSTGVIVRCITPGGAAELDGRLRLGDHIVCIRDHNVRSYGPDQVATVLRQTISNCLSESVLKQDSLQMDETSTNTMNKKTSRIRTQPSTNRISSTFTNTTNIRSEKCTLSPSQIDSNQIESNEIHETNQQLMSNPTVLIRMIVARRANGNPVDLSDISLKQQAVCRQHGVLGMLAIIPTYQLDQYIDVLLHKKLPLVDLYSLYKTDLLSIENITDIYEKTNSNEVDCFKFSKPIEYTGSELIEMNKITECSPTSLKRQEQSNLDFQKFREVKPCSTLQVIASPRNSSESDIEQVRNNLQSPVIENDRLDNKYNENVKIGCNTTLNYQTCSIEHHNSSSLNKYVLENISQQSLSIHVDKKQKNGEEEAEETEIHTVQLTKSKDQGLGLSVVGYIYKNPYDKNEYNKGIFVQNITPNSISDKSKSIQVNDQIIQVNEISLSGLDNLKAISVLKKSDTSITLKLKRYLCGFLCKELKKAGSFQTSNNDPQNRLLNHDEISDSDLNSDQPYSVDNSVLKYNVINSEASDSSNQSAVSRLYQHENYPLNNTNFNQSNILHMELTEKLIDSPCTCLYGHESIQNIALMIFSEEKEVKEMSPLLSNKNNHDQLNPVAFSDRLLTNKNCKLLNPENVNFTDNIESYKQQISVTMMATTIINKQEYQNVTTDQKSEEFTKRLCVVRSYETFSASRFTSNFGIETTSKLEARQNTTTRNISDALIDNNNDNSNTTIGSKEIIDTNRLGNTDHISSSSVEQIKITNEVTDELVDLMRKVWLPIVGPGYDIIVLHIHKSRGTSNLGISIEGVTYVAEPDFDHENLPSTLVTTNSQIEDKSNPSSKLLPNGMAKSAHSNDIKYSDIPSRHFVQYIVPDGLIGSLGVVQKGDELLQANGHRIHGTTHTSTLRYLRNLPSRIELVFARRKSTYENGDDDVFSITGGKDQLIDVVGESLLEVAASEIGSVDTGSSVRMVDAYDKVDRSNYSSPVSPATAHKRVTEWIRKSQGDLSANIHYPSSPESSVTMQTNNKSERFSCDLKHAQSYKIHPLHNYINPNYTSKLQQQYLVNTMKNDRKYSLPSTVQPSETQIHSRTLGRLPISRCSKVCIGKQSSTEQHNHRRCQTLPHYHHNRPNRIDPRYGFKRPCWSSVPLIIQLNKTSHGFGFSIAEYEELPVTDLEGNTLRKAYSLDRRSSNMIESDRRSFHSYYSTGSTIASLSSLPGKNSKSSSGLKRRSTWSSRSKAHGILLVDSLTPGGIAQLDGRISIGDRLLFVNDKNLMKSSVFEAANTLKSLPNGPCLIGIAKMQLESNETDEIHEKNQQQLLLPYPVVSPRPSVIGMFPDTGEMKKISVKSDLSYPLHVNIGDSTIDNGDNNTIMSRHEITACFDSFSGSMMRTIYSCPSLQKPLSDPVFNSRGSITDSDNKYDKYRMLSINKQLFTGNSLDQLQQKSESPCCPRSPTPNHMNPLLLETNLSSAHHKCKSLSYIEQLGKYTNQHHFHRHHSYHMCTLSECGQNHMIHEIQKCISTNNVNQLPLHVVHEIVQNAVDLVNYEVLENSMWSNSTTEWNWFISPTLSTNAGTADSTQSWTQSMISGFLTSSNVNVDDSNNNRLDTNKVDHHSTSSLVSRSSYCTTDNNASNTQYLANKLVIQSILKALNHLEDHNTNNDRLFSSVTSSTIPHYISTSTNTTTIELTSKSREFSMCNRYQLPYITQSADVNNGSKWCSASSKLSSYYRSQLLPDENGHNSVDSLCSNTEIDSNNNNAIIIESDNTDDNDEEEDVKTECDLSTSSSVSLSPYTHPKTMSSSIESDHHEFNHLCFKSLFTHSSYSSPKSTSSNKHAKNNNSISYNNSKTVDKHNSENRCVVENDHDASQSHSAGERPNISPTSHQYSRCRHRSVSYDNHAILDKQLTNRMHEKHEKFDIKNGFNATGSEDLALDFYTLPLLCPNPQLHAPDLQYVTPVDPALEITERLERGSLPIGLKLDALACHGQDGCRVLQVLGGGAVARDQVLVTNDYITSLNGLSMRYLDNLKAFEILHSLSQNSAVIDITYFRASIIESHRIKCLSKTMNQTHENTLQKSCLPYSSIVQPINWSPPIAIVLHRLDANQPWGLVVSGFDICSQLNCSAPMNLENPSIVSEILPNSIGRNCKLLSLGLLILQIQGIDVSTKGPNYVNAYLQYLSDQPDLHEIHIVVCHFNDDCTGEIFNPVNQVNITNYTNNANNNNSDFTEKMELSNYLNIFTPINDQQSRDHIVHSGTTPSSSDMEDPEPLTDMESRDVVDILSLSVPSPDPNNSSDSQRNTYRKINLCPLSQLSSPILKDEDNVVGTDVMFSSYDNSDKNSKLRNGWSSGGVCSSSSSSFCQHLLPPRRLSTTSKQQEAIGYLKPTVVNDSNVNELNFSNPVKLYTRDSQDEVLVIRLPLLINSSSNYTHNVNEETGNLGLRLVSCSNLESMATFVASCQTDSISWHSSGGLEYGDEIVQVEDINVCGLDHFSVQQIIHSKIKELMSKKYAINNPSNNSFIDNDDDGKVGDSGQSVIKSFITLIIRRNPKNLSLMSFSPECNDSPLSVNNLTSSTCSKAFSSSALNQLPTGSKSIPHTFLKEIMVELNEDFWKFQLFDIILERGSDGFGIFIVNLSPNNEPGVFVSEIRPNSPASQQGVLRPHDRILAIDGQLQCDYESTLELLQKSRKSVRLTIGRQIPYHSDSQQIQQIGHVTTTVDNPDNDIKHKLPIIPGIPATVTLYKTDGGLGFSIVGGSDTVLSNILVHEVHSGGAAARDGRLQVGDRLLAVNGIDLREATQKDATKIIRTADDCIQLVVYRDPEPQYINQGVFECHSVHLKRDMPGQSFGLSLIGRPHYSTGTAIGGIQIENSPAARSNLLEVGDIILEINGWDMRLAKSDEVVNLLKNAHNDVKLLIGRYKTGPSMHAYPRNRLNVYVVVLERRQFGFCNDRSQVEKPYSNDTDALVDSVCQKTEENKLRDLKSSTDYYITVKNDQKISGDDDSNNDEIASAAFGLRIRQANSQELRDSHIRLIVDSIQHDSPADRLGMIMPGDRLLSIDREPVDWLNPTQVGQLLANLLYCTIEFGRLPYFNAPLSANNNTISDKCFKHSPLPVTSLCPSHRTQQDEHDMFPPNPPPSLELPTLFGGVMPCIETPSFLRDMCTLPEQQDEDGEHCVNDNHYRLRESTCCTINSSNQQDQIDSMLNMTPLNEEEIKKALELAERGSGGFFVRQIYLPVAPVNTINNTNSSRTSNIHLGLRLVSGPGVSGPVVVRIEPNSCASRTNIQIGDRILGLDDKLLLSLRQDNHSADDILCTIENVWITRSMNSQFTYEQNPCCLTIISYHSLPLFSSLSKQENDAKIEEENSNKTLENNAQLTISLKNLHLINGNATNCQCSISSIEMGSPENPMMLSNITTPLPFESKSPIVSKFQQNGEVGHPNSDDEVHPNSSALYNHSYELSLEPTHDVIHHLPNKNLFVDDTMHVICEDASTTTNKNNRKHSLCVELVSSLSAPPPEDDGVMCNRPLMNINRKFSIQNNQHTYDNNGIMNNKACL